MFNRQDQIQLPTNEHDEQLIKHFSTLLTMLHLSVEVVRRYLGAVSEGDLRALLTLRRVPTASEREKIALFIRVYAKLEQLGNVPSAWLTEKIRRDFPQYGRFPLQIFIGEQGFAGMREIERAIDRLGQAHEIGWVPQPSL